LAGKYPGGLQLFPGHSDITMLADEDVQKDLKQQVKEANLKIDRPFWVFTEMDAFEQFLFFYLDEDPIDPKVYGVTYRNDTEYYVYELGEKFSQYIDGLVDRSILYAERGY